MKGRLESLDVLRGMDMLFIMGFALLVLKVCTCCGWGTDCWLAMQMKHVTWDGLAHHDTIFPLFLFIAGISFPFSYAKKLEKGWSAGRIRLDILRRVVILFVLGLVYNGLLNGTLRLGAVLARIGVAWGVAALLYMSCDWKRRLAVALLILLGYWMLLYFCPAPDRFTLEVPEAFAQWGNGPFSLTGNLSGWIDRHFMPGVVPTNGRLCDNQSALGYIPAVSTAMLGMFCGEFVRKTRATMSGDRQTLWMLGWAVVELALGLLVAFGFGDMSFPINKKLWSSSFVLVVGAYSTASFALVYWLVDVRKIWRRTLFFRVIGMNAITIYLGQAVIDFNKATSFFLCWVTKVSNGLVAGLGDVIHATGYIALCWLFLYFLYRKNVFLKV